MGGAGRPANSKHNAPRIGYCAIDAKKLQLTTKLSKASKARLYEAVNCNTKYVNG